MSKTLEIDSIHQKKATNEDAAGLSSSFSLRSQPACLCSILKCLLGSRFVASDPLAHGLTLQPTTKREG